MTAAPAFLPAGKALAAWLREGARSGPAPRTRLWAYRWKAYWFDSNWRRQEMLHPPAPFEGNGGEKLIFVMGFWRSGTTLLHELLAAGPGMAAPRTWQCMNPSAFRIAGAPPQGAAVTRPMDAVQVDALSPQEDEFTLLALGVPSVYRAWLDPRRWQEVLPALEQDTWLALPDSAWLAAWRTFLGWCMPEGATRLVVKSPNHVFRLKALHRAWPRARFVWTLRDPVDTWQSNRKMWRAMSAMYALWPSLQADAFEQLLLKAMTAYAAALRWAAENTQATYVGFEELGRNPASVLKSLATTLALGSWEPQANPERRPENYAGAAPLPKEADRVIAEVRELHQRLIA